MLSMNRNIQPQIAWLCKTKCLIKEIAKWLNHGLIEALNNKKLVIRKVLTNQKVIYGNHRRKI